MWTLQGLTQEALTSWIESNLADKRNLLAQGYQGEVYQFDDGRHKLVIKVASGRGPLLALRRYMLSKEYQVYTRLQGFTGSPRCYGLLQGRYLVLECIAGQPLRHASLQDRAAFFDELLVIIKELHRRGVAHSDLKRKDNLMVVNGRRPCLIDFGTAIIRKPGFAPVNHFLYELAARFDFNAWAKFKYDGKLENISAADSVYYRRTRLEKIARAIKKPYKRVKMRLLQRLRR